MQLARHGLALLFPFYKPDCTKRLFKPLNNIFPYGFHDVKQLDKSSDTVCSFLCSSMRENGYSKVIPAKNIIITQMLLLFFKFVTTQLRNGPTFAEIKYFGKRKRGHFKMKIAKMS